MIPGRLFEAVNFAAEAHHGQVRKGNHELPYLSHPVSVAMLLLDADCPQSWVIAGLLHDLIEDTPQEHATIAQRFGTEVADIVQECSEDKTRTWEERKRHTITHLSAEASEAALIVSCADKLHNLWSLQRDHGVLGNAVWERFKRGREKQAEYYLGLAHALERRRDAVSVGGELIDCFVAESRQFFAPQKMAE